MTKEEALILIIRERSLLVCENQSNTNQNQGALKNLTSSLTGMSGSNLVPSFLSANDDQFLQQYQNDMYVTFKDFK